MADNDLAVRQNALVENDRNPFKKLSPERHQQILRELQSIDRQKYLIADSNMRQLRQQASDLASTILTRLAKSFDVELQEVAIAAEQRLEEAGIPLSNPSRTDWELWHLNEVIYRHAWREIARNRIENLDLSAAIGACQWLASDEANVPFVWVA